jgi:hypothetical protein
LQVKTQYQNANAMAGQVKNSYQYWCKLIF